MVQFNYSGLSKSSGIYVIFNSYNWRIYVGSTKQFFKRWIDGHYKSLLRNKHSNKFLQADYNKCKEEHGHDDFLQFHVIEDMPCSTREERLAIEEKWILVHFDNGKQCYNLCAKAISREGSKSKNIEETRKRCSERSKGFWQDPKYLAKNPCGTSKEKSERLKKRWDENRSLMLKQVHVKTTAREQHKINFVLGSIKTYSGFVNTNTNEVFKNVTNLRDFCRNHNLKYIAMNRVANKRITQYKGWYLLPTN